MLAAYEEKKGHPSGPYMPEPVSQQPQKTRCVGRTFAKGLVGVLALLTCLHTLKLVDVRACWTDSAVDVSAEQCPQATAVVPEKNGELWTSLGETFDTDAFKGRAVEWLGGAVRVP